MAQNTAAVSPARDQNVERILKTINSMPALAGVITSSGPAVSNATTASGFNLTQGGAYLLQCDAACYVADGATSAAAITAVTGSGAAAGATLCDPTAYGMGFLFVLRIGCPFVAILPVSGTVNAKILQLT